MATYAAITGWGHYVPEQVLTNADLESRVETSDEWIQSRTGIRERRIAGPGETTASMSVLAAQQALKSAQLNAHELDLVICASTTPDYLLPATGCLVQRQIGAVRAGAFDLNAGCSGFLYGLAVGSQFIQAGTYERVLVVAGETVSRFLNWKDRSTCILFGDGAGAVVLESTDQEWGVLSMVLGCHGDVEHLLAIEAGCAAKPASAETLAAGQHYITMRGNDVFKLAVRSMSRAAAEALAIAKLSPADIRIVLPHQANARILKATQEALGTSAKQFFLNLDRYGNTAAASVAIALSEFFSDEKPQAGDHVLIAAFGGGLTWGAAVIRCADVPALIAGRKGH
jgi:3-oxoacyl-[acyl-carrier-protein] synthase-3